MGKEKEGDVERGATQEVKAIRAFSDSIRIAMVVAFYFVVSMALVFLNKNLMSKEFEYPLFITWFQLIVAVVCVTFLGAIGQSVETFSFIPPMDFKIETAQKVLPLALIFVAMVAFNNLCLLWVEVTFYQVARSTTIGFTIVFTYLILGQPTSWPAIRSCLIVILGFVVGSYGEVRFTWFGVIFGVVSSCFVSLYGIYVKKIMAAVDNNQWKLLFYNNLLSIFFMIPFIWLAGEAEGLKSNELLWEFKTWVNLTITGLFGFLINIAVFLQIRFTSPLTNNIVGTAKACVQTFVAMIAYRNPISFLNGVGIFLVIAGSFIYSHIRYSEMKSTDPKQSDVSTGTIKSADEVKK